MKTRLVLAPLLLWGAAAHATTYQVGPTRSSTQIAQVMSKAAPGDVIQVDGNATYSAVHWTTSGTAAQPIHISGIAVNGVRPKIQGGTNTIEVEADYVVVEGFDISGGSSRCFFHHGDHVTLRDSVVHDCPAQGILGADTDSGSLLLEYDEVYHCGSGTGDHQIYMATDEVAHPGSVFRMQYCYVHDGNGGNNVKSRAERNEIYYNWIEGAVYHELELIGPDPGGATAGWSVDLKREDSDVVGNVLRKTSDFYVARIGGDGTGYTDGRYRFVNNTIIAYSGASAVFRLFDELESVEMHNNVFTSASGAPNIMRADPSEFKWVDGTNIAGSNNWIKTGATNVPSQWTGSVMGSSPGLTNMTSDPRPVAGSPLIDAGDPSPASLAGFPFPNPLWPPAFQPPLEMLIAAGSAIPRPSDGKIDIGAFEFGTSSSGTGGTSGATGTGGSGATTGTGGATGSGGKAGSGGTGGSGGRTGTGGATGSGGKAGTGGASGSGGKTGTGGTGASGTGGATGSGGATAAGGSRGGGGSLGTGAAPAGTGGGGAAANSGCSCEIADPQAASPLLAGLMLVLGALRRTPARRREDALSGASRLRR
jgi:hypothetical protein